MGYEIDKEKSPSVEDAGNKLNERASNLGWGIGMLVAGVALLATEVSYLYKALKQ